MQLLSKHYDTFTSDAKRSFYTAVVTREIFKTENVAINDVLPLKATRRYAVANVNVLGARETSDLI